MRRCKIVTWILILSIVNFVLGAPAAVRERSEMSVDVDVAEGGTVMSQKRFDSSDDESATNAADHPPTPPIPTPTPSDLDRVWEELAGPGVDGHIPQSESPGSTGSVDSIRPSYAPPNPGSPAGLRTDSPHPGPSVPGWPAVNPGTLSSTGHQHWQTPPQSPTGGSPLPLSPHPGLSDEHPPGSPAAMAKGTSSSTGHQYTPEQSPTGGSPLPPSPHPGLSDEHPPGSPAAMAKGTSSSTGHQYTPEQSPTGGSPLPPSPHPGLSDDHTPGSSAAMAVGTLSSTGRKTTPPQSPGVDSGAHPPPSPGPQPSASEAESGDLLSMVFKGKIKPRISRSRATSR
jgi:hypothetical protein